MSVIVNFVGRIGVDAEIVSHGDVSFVSCRVAVDETTKKSSQTRWITVNGTLEKFKNVVPHLTKGRLVQVRGLERLLPYVTKNGDAGVETKVWADGIDFIATGAKPTEDSGNTTDKPEKKQSSAPVRVDNTPEPPVIADMAGDDDLPF